MSEFTLACHAVENNNMFVLYRNAINQNTVIASRDDMDVDGPLDNTFQRSLFPENFRDPFALMDPNFQQQFFDRIGATDSVSLGPLVSHPREVREIPIEVKEGDPQTGPSGQAPVIEDVTGNESSHGPEVHGTIIIDDEDDMLPSAPSAPHANIPSNTSSVPTAPPLVHVNDYDDDIEEEMIRAAIEASKKDAEGLANVSWLCVCTRLCVFICFLQHESVRACTLLYVYARTRAYILSPTCFCESCFMTSLVCNNCQIVEQGGDQHPEGVNLGEHSSDEADMRTADGTVER